MLLGWGDVADLKFGVRRLDAAPSFEDAGAQTIPKRRQAAAL